MTKTFVKPKEGFDRPDHPDFMDSSELKKMGFCGMRNNSISGDIEIWLMGEVVKTVSAVAQSVNPNALAEAMSEVFAIDCVEVNDFKGLMH